MKYIAIALTIILTSFYFFPFVPRTLPIANTKLMMAVVGLLVLTWEGVQSKYSLINKKMAMATLYAIGVSFTAFLAIVLNEKNDFTYVTYVISMWVWLSAAYLLVWIIKKIHRTANIQLVLNYLIAACVFQCITAILIQQSAIFNNFTQELVGSLGMAEIGTNTKYNSRMHGFSAGLDFAGSRFAVIELCICYILFRLDGTKNNIKAILTYTLAFFLIGVIGNMISRTTIIGVVLGFSYCLYNLFFYKKRGIVIDIWKYLLLLGAITIVSSVILYKTNEIYHYHLQFGFEGFFSFFETGKWETHSNNILIEMYHWPDNIKTWLIGDGYFENPVNTDPYYIGYQWKGFYQGTDVGYLRFIYYFGILGLIAFSAFMVKVVKMCSELSYKYRYMFILALTVNFIVWLKVSTDLFLFFAPFLCLPKEDGIPKSNNNYSYI